MDRKNGIAAPPKQQRRRQKQQQMQAIKETKRHSRSAGERKRLQFQIHKLIWCRNFNCMEITFAPLASRCPELVYVLSHVLLFRRGGLRLLLSTWWHLAINSTRQVRRRCLKTATAIDPCNHDRNRVGAGWRPFENPLIRIEIWPNWLESICRKIPLHNWIGCRR